MENNSSREKRIKEIKALFIKHGVKQQPKILKRKRVAVSIRGVKYDSLAAAGRAFKLLPSAVKQRCKSENYPGWYIE